MTKTTRAALTRRSLLAGASAGLIATRAWAQQPAEVKVGLLVPVSGLYARPGTVMREGAEMAVDHINAQGGIKSLGGAKMKLVVLDSGDTTEKAKNAAQRMVAQETDLVAASGAYLSSFTLAVTEVTERANLPVLTLSYSDLIADRVRVGEGEDRKIGPLRDFGDGQRKRTQIGTAGGDHIGFLRDHALGGVLGLFGGVTGIEHDELHLGAAERLDAALRVDVVDRHLGAFAHDGARARIEAGDRYQQSDFHLGRLLRPGAGGDQAGGCAGQQAAPRYAARLFFVMTIPPLIFF